MSNVAWTEISEEVKRCFDENDVAKYETDYLDNNIKRWTIFTADKRKLVFEQFFDMNFFKNIYI